MKFGHYFAADAWLRLRSLILVEILKRGFGQDLSCVEILMFGLEFEVGAWSRF